MDPVLHQPQIDHGSIIGLINGVIHKKQLTSFIHIISEALQVEVTATQTATFYVESWKLPMSMPPDNSLPLSRQLLE